VWSAAAACRSLSRVVVATDDERIAAACRTMGAEAMMTSPTHPSGTDRAAEAARRAGDGFDVIVNIQGGQPFLNDKARDPLDSVSPGGVRGGGRRAGGELYFSRSPIPYHRAPAGTLRPDFRGALSA